MQSRFGTPPGRYILQCFNGADDFPLGVSDGGGGKKKPPPAIAEGREKILCLPAALNQIVLSVLEIKKTVNKLPIKSPAIKAKRANREVKANTILISTLLS